MRDNKQRNISYINRDFAEFRQGLIDFIKNYFPDTYNDFNESDPMMMTIELMSYVGDVLSFYTDTQLRESFVTTAEEKINLYNLAHSFGYKVKLRTPAQVDLDVYQLIPSIGSGENTKIDWKYAQVINENMVVSTETGVKFRTVESVDFRVSSSFSPLDVSVHTVDDSGNILYYLLKKKVKAVSGELITRTYQFQDPKPYDKIVLPEYDVVEVVDVVDDDGNIWYEVPYLAQDTIPIDVKNTPYNNKKYSQYNSTVPYLLCYKQVERRFVTRRRRDDRFELQFGSGLSSEADEHIIPNPMNVGMGLKYYERAVDLSIDPNNFLYTRTYGTSPANTTLTVRYSIGGGIGDNVVANSIQNIDNISYVDVPDVLDSSVLELVRNSVVVNNPNPAYGGLQQRDMDKVRLEIMAHFSAQNRAVTREDYILRCYAMPSKYGSIAKAYVVQDEQLSSDLTNSTPNPFALNLYVLAYDNNKNFVAANAALKENLRNYLSDYRLLTDAISIKDAFIVNLGINFEIITRPNYNSNEVILRCISRLKELLANDVMQINQPIYISNLTTELDKVDGVQTVVDLEFICLYDRDSGYSGNLYDVKTAIRNNILYPSVDPCIFEIKYPDRDIKGRVVDF